MGAFEGKVAVVTGASRGIGAAVAAMLACEGARVVCSARTLTEGSHPLAGSLERTVEDIQAAGGVAVAAPANLAVDADCEALIATARHTYGPADILVNNAAVAFFGRIVDVPVSRWVASWRVTVHAPLVLSKLVLPDMLAGGQGGSST